MMIVGFIKGFLPADKMASSIADLETQYKAFLKRAANEAAITGDLQKRLDLAREFRYHYAFAQSTTRFKKLLAEPKVPATIRDQAYYELALTQLLDKKLDDSMKTIRQFATITTNGDNYERSRMLACEIYVMQGNYLGAVNELKNFKTKFPKSPLIANVDMMLPQLERRLSGQVQ
jgi:TolA-binding protein